MKSFIFFIFIIFLNFNLYSQTLNSIENVDTVYIYFDENLENTLKINMNSFPIKGSTDSIKVTIYHIKKEVVITPEDMYFFDFEYKEIIGKPNHIKKQKKFLRKNKYRILDNMFFQSYSFNDIFKFIRDKTIFLIDESEIKKRKIKLKKVEIEIPPIL